MEYYQRLKEIREDKDLTQKEIANIINSSQQQVYKYENGIQKPPSRVASFLSGFPG